MQSLFLQDVDHKKSTNIFSLCEIWLKILEELPQNKLPKELIEYNLIFVNEHIIKENIIFDKNFYSLIKQGKENIGFIEYCIADTEIIIDKFYILEEYKNKNIYRAILKLLFNKLGNKRNLKLHICDAFSNDIDILNSLNYKNPTSETKYIGSNYFLKEEIFEIKKSPKKLED